MLRCNGYTKNCYCRINRCAFINIEFDSEFAKKIANYLLGNNLQSSRGNIWNEKRLFFITPQILQNDLDLFSSLALQIKCLVIDEAHRAKGNHAYCEVIKKLYAINKDFRVLALSATPGKDDHELGDVY